MFEKSLLLSEIFSPYMNDLNELETIFKKVSDMGRYSSVETSVIYDKKLRKEFRNISQDSNWSVTNWIVIELSNLNLSASTTDNKKYKQTLEKIDQLIDVAYEGNCEFFGIASGPTIEADTVENGLDQFENTIHYVYEKIKDTNMKIIIEPLDQFAHKKFLIGDTDRLGKFMNRFDDTDLIKNKRLGFCYDTAHFALNEDHFDESIPHLNKYATKIHLSNAVLNPNHKLYGDHHIPLGDPGFMNSQTAKHILDIFRELGNNNITVAPEVRTHNKEDSWKTEEALHDFISELI